MKLIIIVVCVLQTLSESVSSIQGGVVNSSGFDEVVACTYAGKKHTKAGSYGKQILIGMMKVRWLYILYTTFNSSSILNILSKKLNINIEYKYCDIFPMKWMYCIILPTCDQFQLPLRILHHCTYESPHYFLPFWQDGSKAWPQNQATKRQALGKRFKSQMKHRTKFPISSKYSCECRSTRDLSCVTVGQPSPMHTWKASCNKKLYQPETVAL